MVFLTLGPVNKSTKIKFSKKRKLSFFFFFFLGAGLDRVSPAGSLAQTSDPVWPLLHACA